MHPAEGRLFRLPDGDEKELPPGHHFEYARSGEAILEVEGKPPQTVKPGMGLHTDPGVVHNARNPSKTEPYKYVIVYVLEPGKPMAALTAAPPAK